VKRGRRGRKREEEPTSHDILTSREDERGSDAT